MKLFEEVSYQKGTMHQPIIKIFDCKIHIQYDGSFFLYNKDGVEIDFSLKFNARESHQIILLGYIYLNKVLKEMDGKE